LLILLAATHDFEGSGLFFTAGKTKILASTEVRFLLAYQCVLFLFSMQYESALVLLDPFATETIREKFH